MRVAVFRAETDARRTASRLAELGHAAVLAPVVRIVPTGATVRAGVAEGLVFTSAHAPEALASHPDGVAPLRTLPCWCVGTRTAETARSAGFTNVIAGPGTAAGLAETIMAHRGGARLAFVGGRNRKPDLEHALTEAGLRLAVIEAYEAQAVSRWGMETVSDLFGVTAALHYSNRTAGLARRLAGAAGLDQRFRAWTHLCLSPDVAAGLDLAGPSTVKIAKQPDEASILALLDGMCGP